MTVSDERCAVPRTRAHNPDVVGSNPTPATRRLDQEVPGLRVENGGFSYSGSGLLARRSP